MSPSVIITELAASLQHRVVDGARSIVRRTPDYRAHNLDGGFDAL
jgi:hypothetical protein